MTQPVQSDPPRLPRGTIPKRLEHCVEHPGEWFVITEMGPNSEPSGYFAAWRRGPAFAEFDWDRFEFTTQQVEGGSGRKVMYGRFNDADWKV